MNRVQGSAAVVGLALGPLLLHADSRAPSVFQLESSWTADNGKPLRLEDLRGDVQVVTFFYTTCEAACPLTVKTLQAFELRQSAAIRDRLRFVLISVDPERDTLAALRRYRKTMRLQPKTWKLLRGPSTDVRKLAALLGFNYEQVDTREFVHSNLVSVLNPRGEIVHQQSAAGGELADLEGAVREAVKPP